MMHVNMMLVDAARKGHVVAIEDCSGAFFQSPFHPDGTEGKVWIEPLPEAELGPDNEKGSCVGIPRTQGRTESVGDMRCESSHEFQPRYDGCVSYQFEPFGEHIEEKAGRHVDLAGLLWERQFEKILLKHCWEKVSNRECFFVHREKGSILSVNVEDIKLAGKKQNINPMWKVLNKEVDL